MTRAAFVTGATGFLGLNLVARLSQLRWRIVALDVSSADLTHLPRADVTLVCGTIADRALLTRVIPPAVDAVFHLAANTSAWSRNDRRQYEDNVLGTRNVVDAAVRRGAKRFVFTSSISAYGYHPGVRIDEDTPSNAMRCGNNYGRTKYQAELIVKEAASRGLGAVILNPCNIIGPHDRNNWTRQLVRPIYEGALAAIPPGKAMWCHVRDIVDAHVSAVDRGRPGQNYLLGGVEATFLDVVNEIERFLGRKASTRVARSWVLRTAVPLLALRSLVDGKEPVLTPEKYRRAVGTILCDYRKAVRDLGYETSPLAEMIRDCCAWLEHEDLVRRP